MFHPIVGMPSLRSLIFWGILVYCGISSVLSLKSTMARKQWLDYLMRQKIMIPSYGDLQGRKPITWNNRPTLKGTRMIYAYLRAPSSDQELERLRKESLTWTIISWSFAALSFGFAILCLFIGVILFLR
jgi:hypothetical protein